MNGTRVGPLEATSMFTSTAGYWTTGVDAVRPSTRSMFAPAGGASRTKFPAASVSVNTRPVTAGVLGASTWSMNPAARVVVWPSTRACPETVKAYVPGATLLATSRDRNPLAFGTRNAGNRLVVIPAGAADMLSATRLPKLPVPSTRRLTEA